MGEETAVCRGCGLALKGKPYGAGGIAFHPVTNEQCPVNHFGGFVCSPECDYNASIRMLSSMPGAGPATQLDCYCRESYRKNWPLSSKAAT